MDVYVVIPAAVVVIALLLIFVGGVWVIGNFLVGMIPILNLLFLPLEIGTAMLAFRVGAGHVGKRGIVSRIRALVYGALGLIVTVQAWGTSVLGTDGYGVHTFTREILGSDGRTISFDINNTYRTMSVFGWALLRTIVAAVVLIVVLCVINGLLKIISGISGIVSVFCGILAIVAVIFAAVQYINFTNTEFMNQQITWAKEHSRTIGEYRLAKDCKPNQSMLMNFSKEENSGTTMVPFYREIKAGTILKVTNDTEFDIWMNKNEKYVECYSDDGIYGYVKADLLEGYDKDKN